MIFEFKCLSCNHVFDDAAKDEYILCPKCGKYAKKQFHATANVFIPEYFHNSRSDFFTDEEWQNLKKDPNVERA